MPTLRDEALTEVDEAFESKGLTIKDWRSLIKNPYDLGVMEEGTSLRANWNLANRSGWQTGRKSC